ncbi:hypothetical protein EVAR_103149_1 [Eumeta japonica]|uniref:Uncharacterized protein n=1 Tax=Eumeta variegata TaxID=151549 RepID=A0A4C1YF09_EUMVA|nr:hypothetical protein EVAR_103149_1 [Eumeta japonica]
MTYRFQTLSHTVDLKNKLGVTRPAMNRASLGVCLRDNIRNEQIRRSNRLTDKAHRINQSRRQRAGHVARSLWGEKELACRQRTGRRSVGRPPTKWTHEPVRVTGHHWSQVARDRGSWKSKGTLLSSNGLFNG